MNIDLDFYKTKYRKVDLSPIETNIKELANDNNLKFNDLVNINFLQNPKQYKIPCDIGCLITHGLLKNKEIAVAETEADANTKMSNHVHEEVEIIKILTGELHLTIDTDEVKILKAGDIIMIPSYVVHDAFFPIASKFIAISLPACETWPESGGI